MSVRFPQPLEWQKQLFAQIEEALAAGETTYMCVVGRQAGKTAGLLLWALTWRYEQDVGARGVLAGGRVAICAPSGRHYNEVKAQAKRWLGELISGPSTGDGWEATTGGRLDFWSLGAGAIAPLRGRTYDAVLVDEAAQVPDLLEALESNISPTLSTTGGPTVLGSTPFGTENDFHTLWRRTPAIARYHGPSSLNPAIKARYLKKQRRSMPELRYMQEHDAAFVDQLGAAIKRSEVRVGPAPALGELLAISIGFDYALSTSLKADWSSAAICAVDREKRFWVLEVMRWRSSWPATYKRTLGLIDQWKPDTVVVESVAFSELSVHQLMEAGAPVKVVKPSKATGKEARFGVFHERFVRGWIWLADNLSEDFLNELYAFPLGKNDDQVDAVCYGLTGLMRDVRRELDTGEGWDRFFDKTLPFEREPRRLYLENGSYQQLAIEEGKEVLAIFNPDGTQYTDEWHCELIGDQVVVHDKGVELGRYPRWMHAQLLHQHRTEYEMKYSGRPINKTH